MYHELHWDIKRRRDKVWEVITGWDIGVKGMKDGGKRMLTVLPKLGYGKRGSPPEIPGDAVLCFEVKLLGIK